MGYKKECRRPKESIDNRIVDAEQETLPGLPRTRIFLLLHYLWGEFKDRERATEEECKENIL